MIADFVTTRFITRADYVVDIHAGGRSMNLLPTSIIHDLPNKDQMDRPLLQCTHLARHTGWS